MSDTTSLFLNQVSWDLELDDFRNIKTINLSDAIAQNVATRVRVFKGGEYFDADIGIPYFNVIEKNLPINFLSALIEQESLKVDHVVSSRAELSLDNSRLVTGSLLFTDDLGGENAINF